MKTLRFRQLAATAILATMALGTGAGIASAQTSAPSSNSSNAASSTANNSSKPDRGPRGGVGSHAEVIAKALGITTDQLKTELAAGKTIAQIATAKGVNLQTVIDAWVADEMKEHPELTKEQATERVTNRANGVKPTGGPDGSGDGRGGRGEPGGRGGVGRHADVIAKALGITTDQLKTELAAGKTIAQIATAKGVNLQTVIDAWVADEMKEHPELTKEQATERMTNRANGVKPAKPAGSNTSTRSTGSSTTTS
jgi:mannose/fructose-specific phosphotransferase system component IIA